MGILEKIHKAKDEFLSERGSEPKFLIVGSLVYEEMTAMMYREGREIGSGGVCRAFGMDVVYLPKHPMYCKVCDTAYEEFCRDTMERRGS